jgi:CheY-like chemotaxis protein/GAF domain-containing protein
VSTSVRKLLVLRGPALESQGILDFLQQHFEVQTAEELDGALSAMRQTSFDAVLAETADFLPLERGVVTQQAAAVLDTIGDGVCIVGPQGELAWANRRMREFPASLMDRIRGLCVQAYDEFAAAGDAVAVRGRRFALMPDEQSYFEVICSPVLDAARRVRQVAAVAVNATHQRRQQLKFNAIDRAGRELVSLRRGAVGRRNAAERLQMVEELIVRCSRDVLKYEHFALLLLDEETNRLNMTLCEGLDEKAWRYELFASAEGNGICGYVAATGRSYICPDVTSDSRYLPALANARSSLSVPLRLHDKVIGVFNVESRVAGAFNEEDRQFAEIFANYVALALNILELLVSERHTTHSEVSGSISAELTGPINDIVAELTELTEDYIGHDDLRKRLTDVVDQAALLRRSIQRLTEDPSTAGLAAPTGEQADPLFAGRRVLVADDEETMRRTIRDVLVAYGCKVDTAADGAEAILRVAEGPYDLVISDIKMPEADGYEVFAATKSRRAETPVILITAFGYDPNHSIVRARREGLSAVLFKPFKVRQLLEHCRTAFAGPAQ